MLFENKFFLLKLLSDNFFRLLILFIKHEFFWEDSEKFTKFELEFGREKEFFIKKFPPLRRK